jgi:hypothetical protein
MATYLGRDIDLKPIFERTVPQESAIEMNFNYCVSEARRRWCINRDNNNEINTLRFLALSRKA